MSRIRMLFLLVACAAGLGAQPSIHRGYTAGTTLLAGPYRAGMGALNRADYQAAAMHFQQCIQVPIGDDRKDVWVAGDCAASLAWVFQLSGRLDEAAEILRRLEPQDAIQQQWPSARIWMRARLLQLAGRLPEALRVIVDGVRSYSEGQMRRLASVRELLNLQAELLLESGQMAMSRRTLERAGGFVWDRKAPSERLVRGRLERAASRVLLADGKPDEAEAAARRALELHKQDQAEEAWDVQMDRLALAAVLRKQKRAREAAEIYQQAFKTLTARLGPAQPQARTVLSDLAALLDENGQPAEAARVREALAAMPRPECKVCTGK